jgi:hypothetical protein
MFILDEERRRRRRNPSWAFDAGYPLAGSEI